MMILGFAFSSCSNINTKSKDHYKQSKSFRHGIDPIPNIKLINEAYTSLPKASTQCS